jgi:hypothetical protein
VRTKSPSATLSTTSLTQTGTKSNPGLHGERSATKGPNRNMLEHNVERELHDVGCGGTDWIELAQDRYSWRTLVSAVMNLRVA